MLCLTLKISGNWSWVQPMTLVPGLMYRVKLKVPSFESHFSEMALKSASMESIFHQGNIYIQVFIYILLYIKVYSSFLGSTDSFLSPYKLSVSSSMLHHESVGWVHSKECCYIFIYTFLALFSCFPSKKCVFIILISFFHEVSNFGSRTLISQKTE